MKKLIIVALILLLASPAMASVGVKRGTSHYPEGEVVYIDLGDGGYVAGDTAYIGSTSIVGTSTMVSGPTAIPVTYRKVHQTFSGTNVISTLANGTAGQILILDVTVNAATYTWKITPATATTFTNVTISAVGSYVVLQYLNDTVGWTIIDYRGATIV